MGKEKKSFNLKILIFSLVALAVSLSAVLCLASLFRDNKQSTLPTKQSDGVVLNVNWNGDGISYVYAASETIEIKSGSTVLYKVEYDPNTLNINGDQSFDVTYSKTEIIINWKYYDSASETNKDATMKLTRGENREFNSLMIGDKSFDFTSSGTATIAATAADPDYTGTIKITAGTYSTIVTYYLPYHYLSTSSSDGNHSWNTNYFTHTNQVTSSKNMTELKTVPTGRKFIGWYYKSSSSTFNETIAYNGVSNALTLTQDTKDKTPVQFDGKYFFKVTKYLMKTDCEGLTDVIYARYESTATTNVIYNTTFYWSDADLYKNASNITGATKDTTPFNLSCSAFNRDNSDIFNYGYIVTYWNVKIESTYYTYDKDSKTWSSSNDSEATTFVSDLKNVTLEGLLTTSPLGLETGFERKVVSNSDIYLKPSWGGVVIKVVNGKTNAESDAFAFGSDYDISSLDTNAFAFCYDSTKVDDSLIAKGGKKPEDTYDFLWNYTKIPSTEYVLTSGKYYITVEPVYLTSYHRVELTDVELTDVESYKLSNDCGYTFEVQSTVEDNATMNHGNAYGLDLPTCTSNRIDDYINKLKTFKQNYESASFDKVYIKSGTLSEGDLTATTTSALYIYLKDGQDVGKLPVFERDNFLLIAWQSTSKYYKTSKYSTDYNEELASDLFSIPTWSSSETTLTAYYIYQIDLYYNKSATEYNVVTTDSYHGANMSIDLSNYNGYTYNGSAFSKWYFDSAQAQTETDGYVVEDNTTYITVTKGGYTWTFDYDGKSGNNYYITKVKGNEFFSQTASAPIIKAFWKATHNVTIDNDISTIYWRNADLGLDDTEKNNLFGLYSKVDTNTDDVLKVTFPITDKPGYDYPFIKTDGKAFYHATDWKVSDCAKPTDSKDKGYYLFNYGHEITNWTIKVDDVDSNGDGIVEEGECAYVWTNGDGWNASNAVSFVNVSDLTKTNMQKLAAYLDEIYQTPKNISLTPYWGAVEITLKNNSNNAVTKIGETYDISSWNEDAFVFCYNSSNVDNSMIAKKGVWNYKNIDHVTSSTGKGVYYSSGYSLNITSSSLNNIYRVKLNNVKENSSSVYKLSSGYTFVVDTKNESYTFKDSETLETGFKCPEFDATKHKLIDSYLEELKNFKTSWGNKLKDRLFDIFNKVYIANGSLSGDKLTATTSSTMYIYLASNKTVSSKLPIFETDNHKLILWYHEIGTIKNKYYTTTDYSSNFKDEKKDYSKKDNWTNGGGNTLKAYYVQSIYLFYEDSNNSDGVYSYLDTEDKLGINGYYGENTEVSLASSVTKLVPTDLPANKPEFDYWMIDVTGKSVNKIEKYKTISFDNVTFTYVEQNSYNTNLYKVSSVKGTAFLKQDLTNIIVKAKLNRIYDVTIKNEDSIWSDLGKEAEKEKLYGAYSAGGETKFNTSITFEVTSSTNYAYPYLSSVKGEETGLSFFHKDDWTSDYYAKASSGWYYVFNYGYYISGWTVKINKGDGYYYVAGNTKPCTETPASNEISTLSSYKFNQFAQAVDELCAGEEGVNPTITITPIWTSVNVNVFSMESKKSKSIAFDEIDYDLDLDDYPSGQTLYAYYYDTDDKDAGYDVKNDLIKDGAYNKKINASLIALSGRWNYKNIDNDHFYDFESKSYTYTLNVRPIFLDNIYKVDLTGVSKSFDEDKNYYKYALDVDCGYTFNKSDSNSASVKTFADLVSDYKEFIDSGANWIDDYIIDLAGYKDDYISKIQSYDPSSASLIKNDKIDETLTRVYCVTEYLDEDGNLIKDEDGNLITTEDGADLYIYLVNNQPVANWPVFKKAGDDLIYWKNKYQNSDNSKNYIYPTSKFGEHESEIFDIVEIADDKKIYSLKPDSEFNVHFVKDAVGNNIGLDKVWLYDDGYEIDPSTHEAYLGVETVYFRKNWGIDVNTYYHEEGMADVIQRRGYVIVEIVDEIYPEGDEFNKSGNYLFIYDKNTNEEWKMTVYDVSEENLSTFSLSLDLLKPENQYSETVKIYAGCSVAVHVYDQSQDIEAMNSSDFDDDMIGYKFSKTINYKTFEGETDVTTSKTPIFTQCGKNEAEYETSVDKDTITKITDEQAYISGKTRIQVDVLFEKIVYNVLVKIDDIKAGSFNINTGTNTGLKTQYQLNGMIVDPLNKIDNFYNIEVDISAGFEFKSSAFVMDYGNVLLLDHELQSADNSVDQKYIFDRNYFNGSWLRENLYHSGAYSDYAVDVEDMGTLWIKTQPIVFDLGYIVYDKTDETLASKNYFVEQVDSVATFNFPVLVAGQSVSAGVNTTVSVSSLLGSSLNNENGMWCYAKNHQQYAMLSSKLYFPRTYLLNTNYIKNAKLYEYDFLLNSTPDNVFEEVSSLEIIEMVKNYEVGKIIKETDRQIYILIEVRRLYSIEMITEIDDKDPNDVARTTTLSNGNNNSVDYVLPANADGTETTIAYTYYNLENSLTSSYDPKRYSGVEYYWINAPLTDDSVFRSIEASKFVCQENKIVKIKYIPKALDIEFEYQLDGSIVSKTEVVDRYITDNSSVIMYNNYYLNDKFTYRVSCVHNDYNVQVSINEDSYSTTNINREINKERTIVALDLNEGKIKIIVNVQRKVVGEVKINYSLFDISKACSDDSFGTMTLYETISEYNNEDAKISDASHIQTTITSGRNIYLKFNLNYGYEIKSIKYGAFELGKINDFDFTVDGKTLLISGFDPINQAGQYYVVIDKLDITATLSTVNLLATYKINNRTAVGLATINNLYVGSTVRFENQDVDQERLGYYYYNSKNGDILLTSDGTETGEVLHEIKLTSDVLKNLSGYNINFFVQPIKRYKLNLEVVGTNYLETPVEIVYNANTTKQYRNGVEYCDEGTELTFSVTSKDIGKYDIVYSLDEENVKDEIVFGDYVILLNEDKNLTVTISPKEYQVVVLENVYESIGQVDEDTPVEEDDPVNGIAEGDKIQSYNDETEILFNRAVAGDRELSTIIISGNDMDYEIKVIFTGSDYVAYRVTLGEEDQIVNIESCGYKIELIGNDKIKLSYTTFNAITIRLDYRVYKDITT